MDSDNVEGGRPGEGKTPATPPDRSLWYYLSGDQQHGPVSAGRLHQLARSGTLLPEDLVWREGMDDWLPARHTWLKPVIWSSHFPASTSSRTSERATAAAGRNHGSATAAACQTRAWYAS